MKHTALAATLIALGLSSATLNTYAGSSAQVDSSQQEEGFVKLTPRAKQTFIEGKVEGAILLDEHLNNFKIDIDVDQNTVTLNGDVNSASEKDLAEQVALSVDGVDAVDNKLNVIDKKSEKQAESAVSAVADAAITAKVKASLLTNGNVSGTAINVDTEKNVVTLRGEVESEIESDLAEKITANIDDVKSVENELKVVSR